MISLIDVQRGYDDWAAQPHNKKWVKRLDGTPIANDIVVRIFDALKDAAPAPQPVAVKELIWSHRNEKPQYDISADCPFGRYHIANRGDAGFGWLRPRSTVFEGFEQSLSSAKAAAQADYESRIRSALSSPVEGGTEKESSDDETYELGKRDGYSEAVQQIDLLTGGDGEFRYCTDHDPDRHTPGPLEMIQRIVDRFEALNLLDDATKSGRDQEWGLTPADAASPSPSAETTIPECVTNGDVEAWIFSHPDKTSEMEQARLALYAFRTSLASTARHAEMEQSLWRFWNDKAKALAAEIEALRVENERILSECTRVLGLGTFMTSTFENGRSQVNLSFDRKDDAWTFIDAMANIRKLLDARAALQQQGEGK